MQIRLSSLHRLESYPNSLLATTHEAITSPQEITWALATLITVVIQGRGDLAVTDMVTMVAGVEAPPNHQVWITVEVGETTETLAITMAVSAMSTVATMTSR